MNLEEKVKSKVSGREYAKEILSLIEIDDEKVEFREAFWMQVYDSIPFPQGSHLPPGVEMKISDPRPTMTDEEAYSFEKYTLDFGTYAHHTYANCPTEYLLWLNGKGEQLAAYLRSRIGQERQEEE